MNFSMSCFQLRLLDEDWAVVIGLATVFLRLSVNSLEVTRAFFIWQIRQHYVGAGVIMHVLGNDYSADGCLYEPKIHKLFSKATY